MNGILTQPEQLQAIQSESIKSNGNIQIDLRYVVKNYRTPLGEFPALKSIDLSIEKGQMVAVLGKSGAGKTTLINMISGIDRPTSGDVIIGGTRINDLNENQLAIWRGKHIGVVFQFFQLLPSLTVMENVKAPMDFCGMFTPRERVDRAMHLLEIVEIAEHAHKRPTAVSGGQQQRIAIARALANDPQVIIGDEPTGNLDSRTADTIWSIFENLVDQGKTMLLVTHDEDLARRAGRRIELIDGEIIRDTVIKNQNSTG